MLKKLIKLLTRQKQIPLIGEFKETLAQAIFWGSIINWAMVAGTFYYTTLRNVVAWFSLNWFISVLLVGAVVIFVLEYKYVVPSIWAFRGKQMGLAVKSKGNPSSVARSKQMASLEQKLDEVHKDILLIKEGMK